MALGVIPPLCATLGPVLAGPEGCSRGRWRSGPSKWRHTAAPEGRGQGAPRTCRCIETAETALWIMKYQVREHHAPVGALRHVGEASAIPSRTRQGAPRTCRCIETADSITCETQRASRQGAPRTCRCIETRREPGGAILSVGQGAPRTCRCIETSTSHPLRGESRRQGAPRTCRCIETLASPRSQPQVPVREHHAPVGALRPPLHCCTSSLSRR